MPNILIVGCGDLGGEVARLLYLAKYEVTGVRYSSKVIAGNIQCIQADVTEPESIKQLQKLKPDIIVYCVAAKARTDESYYQHYVLGLKNILNSQKSNTTLQHFFFVSSTRVYGQKTNKVLDEQDEAIADDFGGESLLAAENILKSAHCQTTSLRLSGIYGKGRLRLLKLSQDSSRWPAKNGFSNRIHRDDAAQFIAFLCARVFNKETVDECYIVTDNTPALQYEVLMWLADKQGVNTAHIEIPATKGGKRLSNQRLRNTGFKLQYPNYQDGYAELLQHD